MTRQLVDENDENFSSTRYSQKPKRRLFFDSNEWEDARTNVEKEEENANIDSEEVLRTEIGVWSKNSPAPRRCIRSAFKVSAKKQTRSIAVTKT